MDFIKYLISRGNIEEALESMILLNPEDDDSVVLLNRLYELELKNRMGIVKKYKK